jgi:hypothetical protein
VSQTLKAQTVPSTSSASQSSIISSIQIGKHAQDTHIYTPQCALHIPPSPSPPHYLFPPRAPHRGAILRPLHLPAIPNIMESTIALPLSWISHNLFLLLVAVSITSISIRAVYNLFLSPLSAIPGPWYAAVSDLWITTHVLRLRQCKIIHELFETYGPVVRIGPNKVVFRDLSTMRNVYTVHKFDKSSYYKGLLTCVLLPCFEGNNV